MTASKIESSNAIVCPRVKRVTKSSTLFQSLKVYGIDNAIKNKIGS
jgi:hypothetical protein